MSATLIIKSNDMFTVDVSVSESNKYDDAVQVKFAHNFGFGKVHRTDEVFLTPIQLELFGRFLIRQADELRTAQAFKEIS